MVTINVSSATDAFTVSVEATIPASTPLYQQEQLKDHLYDRAVMLSDHFEEYLIEKEIGDEFG